MIVGVDRNQIWYLVVVGIYIHVDWVFAAPAALAAACPGWCRAWPGS